MDLVWKKKGKEILILPLWKEVLWGSGYITRHPGNPNPKRYTATPPLYLPSSSCHPYIPYLRPTPLPPAVEFADYCWAPTIGNEGYWEGDIEDRWRSFEHLLPPPPSSSSSSTFCRWCCYRLLDPFFSFISVLHQPCPSPPFRAHYRS